MFNFSRFTNSLFFKYTELLFKIVAINILMILASLPIVTIMPAIVAGYKQIRFYINDYEAPIVKSFVNAFKDNFWKHCMIGLITLGSILIVIFSIMTYYQQIDKSVFYAIGLFLSLIVLTFVIIVVIHIPLSCLYRPELKVKETFKFSLYMGLSNLIGTIKLLFANLLLIMIVDFAFPIFIFLGLGIPIGISLKIARRMYSKYDNL